MRKEFEFEFEFLIGSHYSTSQIIPNLHQEKLYDQRDVGGMQMIVALQIFDGRFFVS